MDVNKTVSRMYLVNSEFRELTSEVDLDVFSVMVLAAFRDYCRPVRILVTTGSLRWLRSDLLAGSL